MRPFTQATRVLARNDKVPADDESHLGPMRVGGVGLEG